MKVVVETKDCCECPFFSSPIPLKRVEGILIGDTTAQGVSFYCKKLSKWLLLEFPKTEVTEARPDFIHPECPFPGALQEKLLATFPKPDNFGKPETVKADEPE